MSDNIHKVWGQRRRILLTDTIEADLLYLTKDCFCSTHNHKNKINKFIVISGKIRIDTEYGKALLFAKQSWVVEPPLVHRFYALENSVMIELAYVNDGKIDSNDINRISQGGRIVKGKEMTLDEMREKGLLGL